MVVNTHRETVRCDLQRWPEPGEVSPPSEATVGHASLTTASRYAHARPNDSSSRYLLG